MAIAPNFRKHAEALLYQLELPLHGLARTIQGLAADVLACYRRSIERGTWERRKWIPTPKRASKPNLPEQQWTQEHLMMTPREPLALF